MYRQRALRYAGFYTGDDPQAPNYDKQLKIIRSLHNGSRGPKLTPASVFDWGGETEEGSDRHTRYKTAANIRGDHPLNLCATTLGMNAYLLTGDRKYADWVLEYVERGANGSYRTAETFRPTSDSMGRSVANGMESGTAARSVGTSIQEAVRATTTCEVFALRWAMHSC